MVGAAVVLLAGVCVAKDNGLQRMYVLDCGRLIAKDQSRWAPGVNAGQPREMSNNCYLLVHRRGTLLWETGVPDSVAGQKDGVTSPNGAVVWFRDQTLRSQMESLGIGPESLRYVAISHSHGDHIGNAKDFTKPVLLIQKREYEFAMSTAPNPLRDDQKVKLLSGDFDVFGDDSVTIVSTPGHTPGHQSLLVRLPKTGAVLLTGDVVHFQYMRDNRIVPAFNFSQEQSLAAIDRLAELVARHKAQLWIGHDKDNSVKLIRAPKFYE